LLTTFHVEQATLTSVETNLHGIEHISGMGSPEFKKRKGNTEG